MIAASLLLAFAPTLETADSLVHVRTHENAHRSWVARVWRVGEAEQRHEGKVFALDFSPKGQLARGGVDGKLCLWRVQSAKGL